MNANSLSWGILGTGSIAKSFASELPLSRTGRLVAVASRSLDKAKAFAETHSAAKACGSYAELLADPEVQAVYIATPHTNHMEWVVAAVQAGKHILCEKPLGMNWAEAMAAVEAARQNGVFFMEAYMYRCHPQIAAALELVRSGRLGEIRQVTASFGFNSTYNASSRLYRHDLAGGGILDVGGYPVSFARLVAGAVAGKAFSDPVEVVSQATLCPNSGVDVYAAALLRFEEGVTALVSTGINGALENTAVISGTKGMLRLPVPWKPDQEAVLELIGWGGKGERITVTADRPLYALEADHVAEHLAKGEAPAMLQADTLGNMRTLELWRFRHLVYEQERDEAVRRPLPRLRPAAVVPEPNLYRQLPGFEKPVSRMLLGTDLNGRIIGAPYAFALFDYFVELGGNCFDTAYVYGAGYGEKILGEWMAQRGARDEIHLIAKGAHTPYCYPDKMIEQFHQSLDRLRTDHVEFYMLHRDNPEVPVGEFVEALNAEVKAGRIRCFGGSNWSLARVQEANAYAQAHGLQGFGCVSNQFSLARMVEPVWAGCISASDPVYRSWLTDAQVPLFAWSSQARGFFVHGAPDHTKDAELVRCWYSDDNFERLRRARQLAAEKGVKPIHIAASYVLSQPFPAFALIGPQTLAELSDCFKAFQVPLKETELAWLNLEDCR